LESTRCCAASLAAFKLSTDPAFAEKRQAIVGPFFIEYEAAPLSRHQLVTQRRDTPSPGRLAGLPLFTEAVWKRNCRSMIFVGGRL